MVLGSRYVPGGRVANWGPVRRGISRGASLYTGLFLQMGVHDPTGGFKCFRRSVLETIPLDRVHAKGYAFQIETTYRAKRAGFRVVEVPIAFTDRTAGHSKMSRTIVLEAIWRVPCCYGSVALMREVTDETFEAEVLARRSRWSSTSGRRGAGRAADRAGARAARARETSVRSSTSTRTRSARAATTCCRCRR